MNFLFSSASRDSERSEDAPAFGLRQSSGAFGTGVLVLLLSLSSLPAASPPPPALVSVGAGGRLVYDADSHGDRVPDFSHCGYAGGDQRIPDAPVRVVVAPAPGDSTARIQRAIDYVSTLAADTNGLRGSVLLLKGRHEISGSLQIRAPGVVLRGQGMDEAGTVLMATGLDRRVLIRISGRNDRTNNTGRVWAVADAYVPVGASRFRIEGAGDLKPGDTVNVIRPSTKAWIDRLGMTEFGGGEGDFRLVWKPGSRDLVWDRRVKGVEGDVITLDAPLTTALDKEFGGGRVEPYAWPGRVGHVGVEALRCVSTVDPANAKDENHAWMAVTIENAENVWVRQVTAVHFAGSLVAVWESGRAVTVQDCVSLEPVSEEGGYRRNTFFTMGQQTLFLRCSAERGRHDFSVGFCAAGPNAFVQCASRQPLSDSGPLESWAAGVLYDNVTVDGNGLSLANRGSSAQGSGWAAANSVLWQCSASVLRCFPPPTAHNWGFGCWGEFEGDGEWRNSNSFVKPASLYAAQLADRLGSAAGRLQLMPRSTTDSTAATIEQAAELSAAAHQPAPQLADYIAAAPQRDPIPGDAAGAPRLEDLPASALPGPKSEPDPSSGAHSVLRARDGWLVCDDRLLTGGSAGVVWWRGNIRPAEAPGFGLGIVRFVPGRTGPGFTDDLEEVARTLVKEGKAALDYNYALWHERRRDDHERVRRIDGDVWPPFYDLPFARSGQGTAWDGLSRYDLTRPNPWYWARLREFAGICDRRGLVLFHQNYFQHNILEAGAHYADFPWRTANNINGTGFPEPPNYAGDKRIFMAEQFYDLSQPTRRALHRAYIRQCLDNFATNSNVIQFTSAEFTGPLHFMEFWLDTIAEWERETGRKPLVALSCTKDVQDAILADPRRAPLVDVIDFRYWWQTAKGLFAPPGGKNLAPRQFERQWRGGRPTDLDLARMAVEYRQKYPGKAVICDFDSAGWAFLCAGGSLPRLPRATDPQLLAAIPRMQPWKSDPATALWVLRQKGSSYLLYSGRGNQVQLDLSDESGSYNVSEVSGAGTVTAANRTIQGGAVITLDKSENKPAILWITKK